MRALLPAGGFRFFHPEPWILKQGDVGSQQWLYGSLWLREKDWSFLFTPSPGTCHTFGASPCTLPQPQRHLLYLFITTLTPLTPWMIKHTHQVLWGKFITQGVTAAWSIKWKCLFQTSFTLPNHRLSEWFGLAHEKSANPTSLPWVRTPATRPDLQDYPVGIFRNMTTQYSFPPPPTFF